MWTRWEERPLEKTVVDLVLAWTSEEMDAALKAETNARLEMQGAAAADLEQGNPPHGPEEWRATVKGQLIDLQKQLQGGQRPSLQAISLGIRKALGAVKASAG